MTQPGVRATGAKAIVAAIGTVATAVSTWVAAVAVVASDDRIDIGEVGPIFVATSALVGTIVGVYATRNRPKR